MAQWINILRNNGFVNLTRLPLLYEKTGALAVVEPGLTVGQEAGRPLGRQICCKVREFKFCIFDFLKCIFGISNRFLALIKLYQ